jgi:DNA-binding response OmpR family regulator
VDHAADGETRYRLTQSENFDAVILDLGLPDMKGSGAPMTATSLTCSWAPRMFSTASRNYKSA